VNDPLRYNDPTGHGPIGDALFNQDTYTSSYRLLTMPDSRGWRAVEVPVALGGIVVATADNVLNAMSLGSKGALEGGLKAGVKVGLEKLEKVEGEKAGAKIVKGAMEGVEKETEKGTSGASKIDRAAFRTERETFWKTEAKNNPGNYSSENLERMKQGKAPIGPDGHPMELHHVDRTPEGGTKPMSRTEHRLGENYQKNHPPIKKNE
jgi:hypothetical protein